MKLFISSLFFNHFWHPLGTWRAFAPTGPLPLYASVATSNPCQPHGHAVREWRPNWSANRALVKLTETNHLNRGYNAYRYRNTKINSLYNTWRELEHLAAD